MITVAKRGKTSQEDRDYKISSMVDEADAVALVGSSMHNLG